MTGVPPGTSTSCWPPGERWTQTLLPVELTTAVGSVIGVGVRLGVAVGVGVGLLVGVADGVSVGVGVGVIVGVGVVTRVGVPVAVGSPVAPPVGVSVGIEGAVVVSDSVAPVNVGEGVGVSACPAPKAPDIGVSPTAR